jgi:hypothetical protein
MTQCDKTVTVEMTRDGGQFGSQWNSEISGFSLLAYMINRSLVFSMELSILGRWCALFVSPNNCPERFPKTDSEGGQGGHRVASQNGKMPTHFLLPNYPHPHIFFTQNETSILGTVGRTLMYDWLKQSAESTDDQVRLLRKFVLFLWQPRTVLLDHMKKIMAALGIDKGPFVGGHVRWGDKKSESRLLSASVYAHYLKQSADRIPTKKIFVMSDSSRAISELTRLLPGYEIKSTTPPTWAGNNLASYKNLTLQDRESNNALLLLELTIMGQAEEVVCMMSSNVCRLLQILRVQDFDTLVGIEWTGASWGCTIFGRWSEFLEAYFCVEPVGMWGPF